MPWLAPGEFHTPHYHLSASSARVINTTPLEPTGKRGAIQAGTFEFRDARFSMHDVPIFWWPLLRGNIDTSDAAIRHIRMGYSEDFGAELETDWHLFNVLGLETPEGFTGILHTDEFTETRSSRWC